MKKISFGTDGIRAKMGTQQLTPENLILIGKAFSLFVQKSNTDSPIFIGHDTRHSAYLCKASLKVGLLQGNATIHDYGVVPSPLLYHLVQEKNAYGLMITASHNQAEDNGVKFFTPHGKLQKKEQELLSTILEKQLSKTNFDTIGKEQYQTNTKEWYQEKLKQFFSPHFLRHTKIVVDCANGAYSAIAPDLFSLFGARVIIINNTPDGYNINKKCGSLYPAMLQDTVAKQRADIGFAFDGDGDRLTVVTKNGVIKDGDDIISFLLNHPRYKKNTKVVGTITTNQGFEADLQNNGRTLLRTPVGDTHVTQKMIEENLTLGGEPSGHIILRDFSKTSDALFVALRVCETAIQKDDWTITSFDKFDQKIWGIPITEKKDLTNDPFATVIKEIENKLDTGRVLVRYSGTEPLLRVMIESKDNPKIAFLGDLLCEQLKKYL